jgi:tetratricopeptide (TPR) repeat protein
VALEGCAAIEHRLGRRWGEGAAWILTAHAALALGDTALAHRACQEAEPLVRDLGDDWTLDHLDAVLGLLAQAEHRFTDAATHLRRAAEACGRLGFRATEAFHLATLGRISQQAGDHPGAISVLEQAIEIGRATRDMRVVALARVRLAQSLRAQGDHDAARTAAHAADHWFRASGGGDGAALAACIAATMDAEDGASQVADRLAAGLENACGLDDVEVQVLTLDALAALRAIEGAIGDALDLLDRADALMPAAGHRLVDRDRLDAIRARSRLASATASSP